MIEIKGRFEGKNLNIEKFADNYLKTIADIISEDLRKNLEEQRVVSSEISGSYGMPAPLNPKYKAWKQRVLGYTDIFKGKELKLIKSVRARRAGKLHWKINIGIKERETIAEYVNRKRQFWGISKDIIEQIEKDFKAVKING